MQINKSVIRMLFDAANTSLVLSAMMKTQPCEEMLLKAAMLSSPFSLYCK